MEQPHSKNLWVRTTIFSLVSLYFIGLSLYLEGTRLSLRLLNKSTAWNAILLIGLSLALSGLCYFWNTFDSKIIYRKYLGIVGFVYAVIHAALTLYLLSARFNLVTYFLSPNNIVAFTAALISLLLLTFLTLISHQGAIEYFGGKNWKVLMRFSYVAFATAMVHFFLKTGDVVLEWIFSGSIFPPIAATMIIFAILVILLRTLVYIDSHFANPKAKNPNPQKS